MSLKCSKLARLSCCSNNFRYCDICITINTMLRIDMDDVVVTTAFAFFYQLSADQVAITEEDA